MLQDSSGDSRSSSIQRRSFVVAQNERGQWVARQNRGMIEGVFLTQREAIRFALFETGSRSAAVTVDDAGSFWQR